MATKKSALSIVGPALMGAGVMVMAAAGAVASQGETVGATSSTNDEDDYAAGGKEREELRRWS